MRPAPLVALLALALLPGRPRAADVPDSPALPDPLDLATALRLLRERGLDVLAAEAAVRGAEGDLVAARAIPNPTISGSYGRSFPRGGCVDAAGAPTPCEPFPDPALGAGISDNAALFDSLTGKRGLRTDVASAALAAARLSRDEALRTLDAQLESQFVALLLAEGTLDFAKEVAEAQGQTSQLTRARYDAGAISEADLARIETAKLEADQAVDLARAGLRNAQVALAFLLGVRGAVPDFHPVPGELRSSAPPKGLSGETRDSLLSRALQNRPDVLAARRQVDRAAAAAALARRQRVPDVTLSLGYSQQGTTNQAVSPPTWTFGLSLPLPVFYLRSGEIARAEADLTAQRLALARAEATVVSDVEAGWATFAQARALLARMEGGLLERAKTARDLVTIQYRKGAASLLDLLDAQRTFIAVRLEYLQDLAAYWQAIFRLEQAAGATLR
jgi:cobalt-zinc-cadmium efflux system outer membrane protein